MADQQCLVIIKPDGLVKSLTGNILSILSESNLKIIGSKVVNVTRELAEAHYSDLRTAKIAQYGKKEGIKVFEDVMKYIMGEFHTDRVLVLVYSGKEAIKKVRVLAGSTNPEEADFTTIRGKYGRINSKTGVYENVVHISDSEESAKREIQLWFEPTELTETIYPTKKEEIKVDKIFWK